MSQKLGWKKSKSGHGSNGSTSTRGYQVGRDVTADDDSA
jgi:hypothetical protein